MTQDDMITLLVAEMKLSSYLTDPDDYENAIADALREIGTAFPITDDTLIYWTKQRSKRHLYSYLRSESAHKFKFEQINLQHRFDHYDKLIKSFDEEFNAIKDNLFASSDVYKLFAVKIDSGFQSDALGRDRTYDEDNKVNVFPNENS